MYTFIGFIVFGAFIGTGLSRPSGNIKFDLAVFPITNYLATFIYQYKTKYNIIIILDFNLFQLSQRTIHAQAVLFQ